MNVARPTRSRRCTCVNTVSVRSSARTTTTAIKANDLTRSDRRRDRRPSGVTHRCCPPKTPGAIDLGAGCTPLVRADRLAAELGLGELWLKNDTVNPTGSFKDRVVSVALAKARELGFKVAACPSTGNLANSVAAHAARAGMRSVVFVPSDLEPAKIAMTAVFGGTLVAVDGSYDDVNRLCAELDRRPRGLGVRQRQRAHLLRRGLQDPRLRNRRATRLAGAGPRCRADRVGLAADQDRQGLPRARARSG